MLQTSLGGKVSFVVYIIMLIIVIYLFVDLNSKNNQTVYTFLNLNNDPPQINIDMKDNNPVNSDGKGYFFFLIMFKNKTDNTFIEKEEAERYFYLETMVVERDSTTGVSTNGEKLRYKKCSDIYSKNEYPFKLQLIDESLCVEKTKFNVSGDFISPIYRFYSIKVKNCSTTVFPEQKANCYLGNEIMAELRHFEISLIYLDFQLQLDLHDENKPFNYIYKSIVISPIAISYLKNDIYLSRHIFKSAENLYLYFTGELSWPIVAVSQIRQMVSLPGSSYISFYFRSDYPYNVYSRKYKTFLQLLSQYGGIWTIFFVLGGLIMVPLNNKLLRVEIANRILNLIEPDKNAEQENFKYLSEKCDRNDEIHKIIKLNNKTKLECIAAIDYFKYERNKGLMFTIREAFISIACCCCVPQSIKTKDKIFDLAFKELDSQMDISKVFKYSQQFKILKKILFENMSAFLNSGYSKAIHSKKVKILKEYLDICDKAENHSSLQQAFEKEVLFINGLRSFKFKPILDQRIDVNLLKEFRLKNEFIKRYFINHLHLLGKEFGIDIENDKNIDNDGQIAANNNLDLNLFD